MNNNKIIEEMKEELNKIKHKSVQLSHNHLIGLFESTIQLRNQEIKDELKRRHCCCKREVDGQLCDGCLEIEEVFEDGDNFEDCPQCRKKCLYWTKEVSKWICSNVECDYELLQEP